MDRGELAKYFNWPLEQAEAQQRGAEVERQYVLCAARFRSIATCVGFGGQDFVDEYTTTNKIRLGRYRISGASSVEVWSYLNFARGNAFGVITSFRAEFSASEIRAGLKHEQFGSPFIIGGQRSEMPEFIRSPEADVNQAWDVATYLNYGLQLEPMVEKARNTQSMLINALCNPSLNPTKAPQAITMFKG